VAAPMTAADSAAPSDVQSFVHRTDRGELRLTVAAPTVFVFEYKGYSDEGFVDFIESVWDSTFSRKDCAVQCFADTEAQTGYSSAFRVRLTDWSKRMAARTDTYCLLVRSRWVAMGIAIVRATIGLPAAHAEVTTHREVFRAKLEAAIRRSTSEDRRR
jgi:hypothetical protein